MSDVGIPLKPDVHFLTIGLVRHKLINSLFRDQETSGSLATTRRSYPFTLISPMLFYTPEFHLRVLRGMYEDTLVYTSVAKETLQKLNEEWQDFVLNVCFLGQICLGYSLTVCGSHTGGCTSQRKYRTPDYPKRRWQWYQRYTEPDPNVQLRLDGHEHRKHYPWAAPGQTNQDEDPEKHRRFPCLSSAWIAYVLLQGGIHARTFYT